MEQNLRRSVGVAKNLSFAFGDMAGKLGSSVNLASQLAENIAKVSKNAKIAASATGIGAVVALLGTGLSFLLGWKEKTKEVQTQMRQLARETRVLDAQATGNARLVAEAEIATQLEAENEEVKKLEGKLRHFPELYDAILKKFNAMRTAAAAARDRQFADTQFDLATETGIMLGGLTSDRSAREREAEARRAKALIDVKRNAEGFSAEQMEQLKQNIEDRFATEMRVIEHDIITPLGDQLGRSFANAIADGIISGIREGNIGEGFKALTGGILWGLGDLMQEIGTQSLLAAKLMLGIVKALRSFAPEGAIGPALMLIAGGAVLKGIAGSMGGGGGRGGSGTYGGGSSPGTIIDRGLVNPLNGTVTNAGAIQMQAMMPPIFVIGTDDARAQRDIYTMWEKFTKRRSGG